jgi:Kef-type K+ transport system membrane component KefB
MSTLREKVQFAVRKNILNYAGVLLIFGVAVCFTLELGTRLYPVPTNQKGTAPVSAEGSIVMPAEPTATPPERIGQVLRENLRRPIGVLLLQIITILVTAKIVGLFFHKLRQPTVVGEMIAGILLGPSLLGMISPEAMSFLFPPQSLDSLRLLSQLGVIIFMFIVGTEINIQQIRQYAHAAVLVSHASIIIPFSLGTAFCLLIYRSFAPPHIPFHAFALFMSVAMSITAFPVLARIIEENGLSKSFIGSVALACAAVDDATAWCLLAVVIAVVNVGGFQGAVLGIGLTLLFIGFMIFLFKPLSERIINSELERETPNGGLAAFILVFVFASALFTEVIGVHALFGAFLAGVAMPSHPRLRPLLTERFETVTVNFLLPLYFAFAGLRMQIGLLDDWTSWLVCAGIILIAIVGKLCGGAFAARLAGMTWRDSLNLGVLMNTRGLIELIVLNIGFDLGILTPRVYSMMVLMALVTTFMTGPLLLLLARLEKREAVLVGGVDASP